MEDSRKIILLTQSDVVLKFQLLVDSFDTILLFSIFKIFLVM